MDDEECSTIPVGHSSKFLELRVFLIFDPTQPIILRNVSYIEWIGIPYPSRFLIFFHGLLLFCKFYYRTRYGTFFYFTIL